MANLLRMGRLVSVGGEVSSVGGRRGGVDPTSSSEIPSKNVVSTNSAPHYCLTPIDSH